MALNIPNIAAPTNEGDLLSSMRSINSLRDEQLKRRMQELQNKYYGPTQEGKIQNQLLENKWYEPKAKAAIDLQNAQTGHYPYLNAHTAAQTNKLNMMTPLEAEELKLKNQIYPELTKSQIANNFALAKQRQLGGAGLGTGGKEELFFQNLIAKDNPQLDANQVYEASNAIREGRNTLADGTKINPLSRAARASFNRLTKGETTSPLITSGVRTNQAEAEIEALANYAQDKLRPYGTTYFGVSPKALLDSFSSNPSDQKRLGQFLGARQLQFEIAQNEIKLANGQPGVTQTHDLMKSGMQNISATFPKLSAQAREEAQKTFIEGLKEGKKARDAISLEPISLNKNKSPNELQKSINVQNITNPVPPKELIKVNTNGTVNVITPENEVIQGFTLPNAELFLRDYPGSRIMRKDE